MAIDRRHPREIRADIRSGKLTSVTAGWGEGYVQANLAVLPKDYAYDFLLFCQRNPRPCPLIEVTDVGSPEPVGVAPGADLRTDLPRYRIYKDGVLADEVTDATPYWRDDLVAFLLGCSFTFEWALLEAGIDLWHVKHGKNVAMWKTSRPAAPRCPFTSASNTARSCCTPPRDVLTKMAPRFMSPSVRSLTMPRVSSVSGVWQVSTSTCGSSASRLFTGSAPRRRISSSAT